MNTELLEALTILEKEKNISKEVLMEAIEQSLIQACKNHFGKADNVHVTIDHETCEFSVYADKTVVEVVEDPVMEISLSNAKMMDSKYELGYRSGSDSVQTVRTYRDTERKECDSAEDP